MVRACITSELGEAVGQIAAAHRDSGIQIEYRDGDPEQVWHVTADDGSREVVYVCNDETGSIEPRPPRRWRRLLRRGA